MAGAGAKPKAPTDDPPPTVGCVVEAEEVFDGKGDPKGEAFEADDVPIPNGFVLLVGANVVAVVGFAVFPALPKGFFGAALDMGG